MKNNIYLYIFLLFSSSCQNSQEKTYNDYSSTSFKMIESRRFEVDSVSSFEFYYFDYGEVDGKEKLFVVNSINFSVDVYSLESEKVEERFKIPKNGPGFINKPQGILFHSPDSIFIFPAMLISNIVMFNQKGELYHFFQAKLQSENKIDRLVNHASLPSLKTYLHENHLVFFNLTLGSPTGNSNFFSNYYPNFRIDLENDSLYWLQDYAYPAFYFGKYWPDGFNNQSSVRNLKGEVVSSWAASDSLIIRAGFGSETKNVLAKSKYARAFTFGVTPITQDAKWKLVVENHKYIQILYDPFRNLYYRIVLLPREVESAEYLDHTSSYKNDFSVIVLDNEFQILEEVRFKGSTYHPFLAFVGKKGLYISRGNPYNKDLNEDEVIFDVFEWKGI